MIRICTVTLLACVLALSVGCDSISYVFPPTIQDTGASTDQYVVEFEYVPDAQMVTEDISPVWDLGRHAFKRGTDRILIISRTTSYSDKDEDYDVIAGTMRERRRERAWITIPGDVPLGKAIKLEDIEKEFYTGFDVNNLDGNGPLNSTALMKGYVKMTSLTETEATFELHIEIRPNRPFQGKDWVIQGEEAVKIYQNGHYATYTVSRDDAIVVQDREGGIAPKVDTTTSGANTGTGDQTNTQAVATTTNAGDNANAKPVLTANGNDASSQTVVKKEVTTDDIIGKWTSETKSHSWRFQFEKSGVFIVSKVRGNGIDSKYAPGMRYGFYTVKQSRTSTWLVLDIKAYYFDVVDHMKALTKNPLLLKLANVNGKTVISGSFTENDPDVNVVLEPANFEDLNKVQAPVGRRKDIPGKKNPRPFKLKPAPSSN